MTAARNLTRELAERTSDGTLVRLFWLQGTHQLWVEICDPELDVAIVIPTEPDRALDTFHHPYAYAASDRVTSAAAEPLEAYQRGCPDGFGPALG